MAANFTDNWFVLKSRLCLFAPLRDDFEFLLDKSEAGGAGLLPPAGGASLVNELNTRFNTVWDDNKNEDAAGETPLDYRGTQVKALTFGEGDKAPASEYNRRYIFNSSANAEMNRMVMTPNRTVTINFWIRCIKFSRFSLNPLGYPFANFCVSSNIDDGIVLGADFAMIEYGKFRTAGSPADQLDRYILRLADKQYSELVASDTYPGATPSGSYTTPSGSGGSSTGGTGVWFMVTHVLELGANADDGIVVETHVRYKDEDDDYVHLVWKQYRMQGDLWGDSATSTAIWGIGLPGNYDNPLSDDNQIALRNFMVYEARLDDTQQKRIFDNGIDPFQADPESTYDFDQHDRNYWGSYGILGTRSNLRVEKSAFTTGQVVIYDSDGGFELPSDGKTHGLPFRQWKETDGDTPSVETCRREHIALRDNSMLVMIGEQQPDETGRGNSEYDGTQNFYATKWKDFAIDLLGSFDGTISREPYSTEVTQRYIYPSLNAEGDLINYFTNRPSIISWRNSRIAGTRSTDPYRVWLSEGSTFNGFSDAVMISDMAHPEDLPSGTYVAALNYDPTDLAYKTNPESMTIKGYPKHIGLLKFQYEAGQINYSNSFTYDKSGRTVQTSSPIFWERQQRYIVMEWDAQASRGANYGGPVQYDALNWKPIVWRYVVYEIQEASKLSDRENLNAGKYQGKIIMHLFGDPITSGQNKPAAFESDRYRHVAIYEKPYIRAFEAGSTTERDYGGWNFVEFQPDNKEGSNLSNQFANRIYLPRITIPHIKIPVLKPKLTVIKDPQYEVFTGDVTDGMVGGSSAQPSEMMRRKLFVAGGIAFYAGGDDGWRRSASYVRLDGTVEKTSDGSIVIYHDNKILGESGNYFCPLSSGWYALAIGIRPEVRDQGGGAGRIYINSYQNGKQVGTILNARLAAGVRVGGGESASGYINAATNKLVWLEAPKDLNDPSSWIIYKFDTGTDHKIGTSDASLTVQLVSPSRSEFNKIVSAVDIEFDIVPTEEEKENGASGGETPQRFYKYVTNEKDSVTGVTEQWIHLFNVEGLYSRFNKSNGSGATLVTNAAETVEPAVIDAEAVTNFWVNSSPYQEDGAPSDVTRSRSY